MWFDVNQQLPRSAATLSNPKKKDICLMLDAASRSSVRRPQQIRWNCHGFPRQPQRTTHTVMQYAATRLDKADALAVIDVSFLVSFPFS